METDGVNIETLSESELTGLSRRVNHPSRLRDWSCLMQVCLSKEWTFDRLALHDAETLAAKCIVTTLEVVVIALEDSSKIRQNHKIR